MAALQPLSAPRLARLRGMLDGDDVAAVYNSNAIEGNSLTLGETALVIERGIAIAGKPLADQLEALDQIDALRYARTLGGEPAALTQHALRELHALVLRRSKPDVAGRYRDIPVTIGGSAYMPPSAVFVPERMSAIFERYENAREAVHPVVVAADLHRGIVDVHPFEDGNGRTARLAMNVHLLQRGFPFTIVEVADRVQYIAAIEASRAGEPLPFREYVVHCVERALERYSRALDDGS